MHPLLISNILKRRTSKGERKVSDREGELETICKSCGLDSHGMIGESQVKDVFFSLKTLESKVVSKVSGKIILDFIFSTKALESQDTLLLLFNKHLLYTSIFWANPSKSHVRSSYKIEFLPSRWLQ